MIFFTQDEYFTGPKLTAELVSDAERQLGYRLPRAYIDLLFERNGGRPVRRCFPMTARTSWAEDHIKIDALVGIGGTVGIVDDDGLGSAYMIEEWGYPRIGVVICAMPSGGHDTIMLDYRECGPSGEPAVVYIDEDRSIHPLARTFAEFLGSLVVCGEERGQSDEART
jgi:hypothetical protein